MISDVEFERWREYYIDFPFDDFHRYGRPSALISSVLSKGHFYSDFCEFLEPKQIDTNFNEADLSVIKALGG